jgi:hypothetical protein
MAGLWRVDDTSSGEGFFNTEYDTHTLLAASGPRESAVEGNNGGRFTQAFIKAANSLPLHQTSYVDLISHIILSSPSFDEHHKSHIIFHALPFVADESYIALNGHFASDHYRIELGSQPW